MKAAEARVDALEAALRGLTDWVDDSPDVYAAPGRRRLRARCRRCPTARKASNE
jgi:hypothetical protein